MARPPFARQTVADGRRNVARDDHTEEVREWRRQKQEGIETGRDAQPDQASFETTC